MPRRSRLIVLAVLVCVLFLTFMTAFSAVGLTSALGDDRCRCRH